MKKKPLTHKKTGEVRELTREDIREMRSASDVLPASLTTILPKRTRGQRGLQKHPTKVPITIRYSPDVIEYFKSTGSGWQSRIDMALKEWISKHPHVA